METDEWWRAHLEEGRGPRLRVGHLRVELIDELGPQVQQRAGAYRDAQADSGRRQCADEPNPQRPRTWSKEADDAIRPGLATEV